MPATVPTRITAAHAEQADRLKLPLQSRAGVIAEALEIGLRAVELRREDARRAQLDAELEPVARAIYDGWKDQQGWVPWVEGGNSTKQDEARRLARGHGAAKQVWREAA